MPIYKTPEPDREASLPDNFDEDKLTLLLGGRIKLGKRLLMNLHSYSELDETLQKEELSGLASRTEASVLSLAHLLLDPKINAINKSLIRSVAEQIEIRKS